MARQLTRGDVDMTGNPKNPIEPDEAESLKSGQQLAEEDGADEAEGFGNIQPDSQFGNIQPD
jgi:hypothetical protein